MTAIIAIKHVTWLKINNWYSFGCIEKKKSRANNDETVIRTQRLKLEVKTMHAVKITQLKL